MTRTITRAEYDRKRQHGYAGPARELLDSTREHITTPFWMLSNEGAQGTCLVGVEVLDDDRATIVGADAHVQPDERDDAILAERVATYAAIDGPRVGDFVRFADGVERRVSHIWRFDADDDGPAVYSIQTSDGGSYFLGDGYISMSGGLFPGVDGDTFAATGETKPGSVWFFHHDHYTKANAVHASVSFRVFSCSLAANQ